MERVGFRALPHSFAPRFGVPSLSTRKGERDMEFLSPLRLFLLLIRVSFIESAMITACK
jgi:hypothetical protein